MRLRAICGLVALLAVFLGGCAKPGEYAPNASQGLAGEVSSSSAGPQANGAATDATRAPADAESPTANITPTSPDRYLIRNAALLIEVKDARVSNDSLIASVRAAKGYVSNLQETVDALGARTVTMQVRVPSSLFDSSMQQLAALGKVLSKHVSAEDVTEEYVDTESTVRNLKRTEARLLEHLNRTGKLSDTLLIEKELTRVRQEVEQREGRLRFLSHRVSFSTIDVTLQEAAKLQSAVPPESYSTAKEASDATRSLLSFGRALWTVVIWLGIWAVVWVPLALAGVWIGRKAMREYRKPGPPKPPFYMPDERPVPPDDRTGVR
jgi:hypothetical protein